MAKWAMWMCWVYDGVRVQNGEFCSVSGALALAPSTRKPVLVRNVTCPAGHDNQASEAGARCPGGSKGGGGTGGGGEGGGTMRSGGEVGGGGDGGSDGGGGEGGGSDIPWQLPADQLIHGPSLGQSSSELFSRPPRKELKRT